MAAKRAGTTVKVSVSLEKRELAALKKIARERFGGNLSAAFAAAAGFIQRQEAGRRLVDLLGGPSLTEEARRAIDAEQDDPPRAAPARRSTRGTAA
jgi:hypothetical protein